MSQKKIADTVCKVWFFRTPSWIIAEMDRLADLKYFCCGRKFAFPLLHLQNQLQSFIIEHFLLAESENLETRQCHFFFLLLGKNIFHQKYLKKSDYDVNFGPIFWPKKYPKIVSQCGQKKPKLTICLPKHRVSVAQKLPKTWKVPRAWDRKSQKCHKNNRSYRM